MRLENNVLGFRKKFGADSMYLGIVAIFYDLGVDVITKGNHGELEKKEQHEILRKPSTEKGLQRSKSRQGIRWRHRKSKGKSGKRRHRRSQGKGNFNWEWIVM